MTPKETISILGIKVSTLSRQEIFKRIDNFFKKRKNNFLTTPNPEILLSAQNHEEYFYILNQSSLSIADGIGLKFAALLIGKKITRITGVAITRYLLKKAESEKLKVLIINWNDSLTSKEKLKLFLERKYPDLDFAIISINREEFNRQKKFLDLDNYLKKIKEENLDIIFNCLGAFYQEKLIYDLVGSPIINGKERIPEIKCRLAIGVGGAFDFLSGTVKRAPYCLRKIGLEWLWRLFRRPNWQSKIKRIYQALIIFPIQILRWRFVQPFLYRNNVACLIYKREEDKVKILIVERQDEFGHWQIPQGGTDGESLEKAALKEVEEELNISKKFLELKLVSKKIYKYSVVENNDILSRVGGSGFRGQKQGLVVFKFLGNDREIKINYWDHSNWMWVDIDSLVEKVHPVRKTSVKIFLNKFRKKILEK